MFLVVGGRGYHELRTRVGLRSWARCVRHVTVLTDPNPNPNPNLYPNPNPNLYPNPKQVAPRLSIERGATSRAGDRVEIAGDRLEIEAEPSVLPVPST